MSPAPVTTCSAALADLVQTLEAINRLYQVGKARELTDREDARLSALEHRSASLEQQIKREVKDKLGVDYSILWAAVTG